ncbi:Ig-like domain-containing protein [Cohnella candidum]|uniref:Tandem-95 repeat protein n=1 Tax=Cohnella candidum TaxID=2674991 RepID=A0A3G3K0N7_9BACL|nr:Ig-like domain-containing protein [Cohnella candidum]AYQ73962.1 hypothetical protein EAV92_16070 [Cohnella candidum]
MRKKAAGLALLAALSVGLFATSVPGASADSQRQQIEQDDPRIQYNGTFTPVSGSEFSSGNMKQSLTGGTISFRFVGNYLKLGLAAKYSAPMEPKVQIIVDGNPTTVDLANGGVIPFELDNLGDRVENEKGEMVYVPHQVFIAPANVTGYKDVVALDYIVYDNYSPSANPDHRTTRQATPVSGKVTGTDPNQDALTFSKSAGPVNGTAAVNADGSWTYAPAAGFTGTDSFGVTASDPFGLSAQTTVTVDVANIAPIAAVPFVEAETGQGEAVAGQAGVVDAGGDALIYAKLKSPLYGTVDVDEDGSWTYTPQAGYSGVDYFSVKAVDPSGDIAEQLFVVTVHPSDSGGTVTPLTGEDIEDGTIGLADLADDVTKRLSGGTVLTVVQDQPFDVAVAGHDSLQNGAESDGVTVTNTDGSDGYIRLSGTLTVPGIRTVTIDGASFVFDVTEAPADSPISVTFDE